MKCFFCQNKLLTQYNLADKTILACRNDQLFFSRPKEIKTDKNLYDKNFFNSYPHSNTFNLTYKYFLNKLELVQKLTNNEKPKILDIGCGWGDFLAVCQKEKIPYLGVDTSSAAINLCRSKNLNCRRISPDSLAKESDSIYDAVVSFQTIEHIENPTNYLKTVKKLLKKNGVFVLTTPNNNSFARYILKGNWSVYRHNGHFVFYNKKNLAKLLTSQGFRNVKINIDNPRFFTLQYLLDKFKPNLDLKLIGKIPVPTDPMGDLIATAYKIR